MTSVVNGSGHCNHAAQSDQGSEFARAWKSASYQSNSQSGQTTTQTFMASTAMASGTVSMTVSVSVTLTQQVQAAGQQAQNVQQHLKCATHTNMSPFNAAQQAMATALLTLANLIQQLASNMGNSQYGGGMMTQMQSLLTLMKTLMTLMQSLRGNAYQGPNGGAQPNATGLNRSVEQLTELMELLKQLEGVAGQIRQGGGQAAQQSGNGAGASNGAGAGASAGAIAIAAAANVNVTVNASAAAAAAANTQPQAPIAVENGRIWGDPHFVGADGGKYDVQGQDGKIYNILSDNGIQMNGRFDGASEGRTYMGAVGMTMDNDKVSFDKTGKLTINGQEVGDGDHLGGKIRLEDGKLFVKDQEYSFELHAKHGNHLNMENMTSANAVADGVMPSGLWGGTVDGDGQARNGDEGKGMQGGGAIEKADGSITSKGDTETVKQYEVGGLFDTNFKNFNQFNANGAGQAGGVAAANASANAQINVNAAAAAAAANAQGAAAVSAQASVNVNINVANGYQQVPYQGHAPIKASIEGAGTLNEGGWNPDPVNRANLSSEQVKQVYAEVNGSNAQDYRVKLDAPAKEDMMLKVRVSSAEADQLTRSPKVADLVYDRTGLNGAVSSAKDLKADYSIYDPQGDMVTGDVVDVLVRQGETTSEAFKIQAWQEVGRNRTTEAEADEDLTLEIVSADPCLHHVAKDVTIKEQATATVSPIAFDMNGDGKIGVTGESTAKDGERSELGRTVQFDIDGDGQKDTIEWMNGDGDALLVDNRDGNAANDMSGKRLFGDEGGKYTDGYQKLAQLDGNGDGILTAGELQGMMLWQDNGNAIVDDGELVDAKKAGVTSISAQRNDEVNEKGETLMRSSAQVAGEAMMTEDVWFGQDN